MYGAGDPDPQLWSHAALLNQNEATEACSRMLECFWDRIPAVLPRSRTRHLAAKLPKVHRRLHQAARSGQATQTQFFSTQGKHTSGAAVQHLKLFLQKHSSTPPGLLAEKCEEQAGPDISRLPAHLQEEWDPEANAHLGSITITPRSGRKVWWRSGMCKTGQPHRWQTAVYNRAHGRSCPYQTGKAVCPCNDLRGGSRVGLGGQWGEDTRDCDGKHPP